MLRRGTTPSRALLVGAPVGLVTRESIPTVETGTRISCYCAPRLKARQGGLLRAAPGSGHDAMQPRTFLKLSAAAGAVLPFGANAAVPKPYSYDAVPPMDNINAYVRWMQDNRGEDPRYLRARFERFQNMVGNRDVWDA